MSIVVARFLQEDCEWDTELVGSYTSFGEPHAWVLVEVSKGKYIAIETTADPLNCLGEIMVYEECPEYYTDIDIYYEWYDAGRFIY